MIFWFLAFFGVSNHVLWFDLLEQIASKFQNYSNKNLSDENFSSVYSSKFSKDPFSESMSNIENRSMQLKIAWVQYVENLLWKEWCDLSQKEILWILYYYVPEFRTEFVRSMKQEMWDYDNKKYVVSSGTVEQSCLKYYLCKKKKSLDTNISTKCQDKRKEYAACLSVCKQSKASCCKSEKSNYETCVRNSEITASSPSDVESYCKDDFKGYYANGLDNKEVTQQVEVAQIWADKYWNSTTDDSPYDIMSDMWVFAKLLYYGIEEPITPVVYNIPMFSNSVEKLLKKKNSDSSPIGVPLHWWNAGESPDLDLVMGDRWYDDTDDWWDWVSLLWWDMKQNQILNWWTFSEIKWLPLTYKEEDWYDDLVDWLNSLRLGSNNSNFYTSLCKNEEEDSELKHEIKENKWLVERNIQDFSNLSDREYQEIVDYMLDAVDDYSKIPADKEEEIRKNMWDINNAVDATTASELEEAAEKIKNCWKSCEGLRIDQKASCMLKCACWERSSAKINLFNPEKTPWLWPIFLIRYCAVPAVNTNFSVGWKRIYSIEEWLNEIYGVVDKLSREWKLWKWTQQYEFLDSSTKKINIANTFAFSIDVDFVDITNKGAKHSDQYKEKELENFNEKALMVYGISNPLNDPSAKNAYRIDQEWSEWWLKPLVDLIEDSKAYRYGMDEESIEEWMDQQAELRKNIYEGVLDYINYSQKLYTKKS